ncbi:MAG: hypothetical protein WAW00_01130 [Candidatus Moraniibacteriota bacterium]
MSGTHKMFLFSGMLFLAFGFAAHTAGAAIKDSDADGLADEAEANMYHTDTQAFDTDEDSRGDGDEVLDGTDPLDPESSRIAQLSSSDPGIVGNPAQFAWYLGRASGFFALVLLFGVAVLGLVLGSCVLKGEAARDFLFEAYRVLVWLAAAAIALRFGSFIFDGYLHFSVVETLLPFTLSREFTTPLGFDVGKAATPGIIAFYLMVIVALVTEFRGKFSAKVWQGARAAAFLAFFLFVLHQFMFGIESREWWMRAIYSASVSIVLLLALARIIFCAIAPRRRVRQQPPAATPAETTPGDRPLIS